MFLRHQRELILVHGTSETDTACGWLCSLREGLNFCVPSTPLRVCIQDPGISAESVLHSAFVDNIRQHSFYRQRAFLPSFILGIPGLAFCPVNALLLDR